MKNILVTDDIMCVFQGDISLLRMPEGTQIPEGWVEIDPDESKGVCLAYGEVSGHAHAFREVEKIKVYRNPANENQMMVLVVDNTALTHEEHDGCEFSKTSIWFKAPQEEYTFEEEYRVVAD